MQPPRILLVDDDAAVRDAFGIVLKMAGHDVTCVDRATEALALQEARPFDLVITDIVMPDMDGLELIRVLADRHPATPILVMSGGGDYGGPLYLDLALRFGARAALAKPCAPPVVLRAIRAILSGAAIPPTDLPPRRAAGG